MSRSTRQCPVCLSAVPADFSFCGRCGAAVGPLTQTADASQSDRRTVTVLFADLSGFTRLGRELDPEDLKSLLDECLSELLEEVTAREGWLDKQIGDAILAVFGAPIAHEDDPVRALRAAIAMQARMEAVNVRLKARLTRPLALHIGVPPRLVVTGPGLDTGIGEFTVI